MAALAIELKNNKPARYLKKTTDCIKIDPIYIKITGRNRTAAFLLAQILYWINCYLAQGKKEFYNSDKDFAAQIRCECLRTFERAKRKLIKLGIISVKVRFRGHRKVSYYELCEETLNALIEEAKNPSSSLVLKSSKKIDEISKTPEGHMVPQSVGLLHYKLTKCRFTLDKVSVSYIDTKTTTKINKRNTSYFKKTPSSNELNLKPFSYEQKPMSGETDLPCSKEIVFGHLPTLENEQSDQEGKSVGTSSNSSLKAGATELLQGSKAKKKATKVNSAKVIKTKIDRNLELTPERRQVGLNARFLNRGLVEGVIETEFESFIDYFTETGTLRSDWDLSWKNWCKKAIELDKYNRKTIENPIRSGMIVSSAIDEKVSIDSAFAGFVKEKLNGMQFEFEGATYAEMEDKIVIDQQNSFRRELIEKLKDKLEKYFCKGIELKWLRSSWGIPAVSKQEKEMVTPGVTEIVTSDVSIPSPVPPSLYPEEIPLETPPSFETWALLQESSESSGIDKSLKILFEAMRERSGIRRNSKTNPENSPSEEKNASSLTEGKNNQEVVENVSDGSQLHQSEQTPETKSVMISASVDAVLAADQLKPNEDLQENESEISITQLCLEFPDAISAKPAEEEIRLEVRERINNLPPPRTSNVIDLAITCSTIILTKPKPAFHLPKLAVTAAKSFSNFHLTTKRLSNCAEMIEGRVMKVTPLGLAKTAYESLIGVQFDIIIPAEVVNAAQAVNRR